MANTLQKGHVHAELMVLYAEDAKTTDKPWELWQFKVADDGWRDLTCNPTFSTHLRYRRKPKTRIINGFEVPSPETKEPNVGSKYFISSNIHKNFFNASIWYDYELDKLCLERGLVFLNKEDAIANTKAMLGIDPLCLGRSLYEKL